MNLKQSIYNLEIEKLKNNSILVFNSYSRAFGIMSEKCKRLYDRITEIDENLLVDEDDIRNLKVMKDNQFIVHKDIDELELIKLHEKIAKFRTSNMFSLTIAPTLDCNMACPYCYERKTNERMSDETMQYLINFIEKQLEDKKHFFITWYGGEPLLEKQRIYDISKAVLKICKEKNIEYHSNIITNGVLLDYDTAKRLKEECNVYRAQITLDGYGEENNKRRRLKNGGDSFKIITDNIDKAKEFLKISIRVNVDKTNVNSVSRLMKFFMQEKKWTSEKNVEPYVAPVCNLSDRDNFNSNLCYSENEFLSIDSLVTDKLFENKCITNLDSLIPPRRLVSCAAICLGNSYVISPKGLLYTCWDVVGMKEHNIGNVKNGPQMNPENVKWLSLEIPINCYKCKLLPLCLGGCPSLRLLNPNKKHCSHNILNYKENLKRIYKQYRNKDLKKQANIK